MEPLGVTRSKLEVKLDWRSYFYAFVEKHGEPVDYAGRLLFPDGWTYAYEYQGPEYPPPTNPKELRSLLIEYWIRQTEKLEEEFKVYDNQIKSLTNWADTRDLPLMQVTLFESRDDKGVPRLQRSDPTPLDLSGLKNRRDDTKRLLDEGINRLEQLKGKTNGSRGKQRKG